MTQLLGLRLADLLTPVNPDAPVHEHEFLDTLDVVTQEDLITVHRELLDMTDRPGARTAATIVSTLSSSARRARTDRAAAMVIVVFRAMITDLRAPLGTPFAEGVRFSKTFGELAHLDMINRADRDAAAKSSTAAR